MSIPKEPRQIMINLMYLVLTALLALNVSNEILHAFKVINQSVTSSNLAIVDKNAKIYETFNEIESQEAQRDRIKPFNDKAKEIKKESDAAVKYLEDWKEKVVARAGGRDEKGEFNKEDDIDASTFLLVEQKGGAEIKSRLVALRSKMLGVVTDPAVKSSMEKNLPIKIVEPEKSENNPQADWSYGYFHNMPTVAAVTLLAKFQNDIRNSEAQVLNQLLTEAGNQQMKFDEMAAIAVPKNSYVLAGQKVEANIMLAAYNKAVQPQVVSSGGGGRVTKVENGVAIWETTASGTGVQKVQGTVSIDLGGRKETRNYSFEYMVGSTGASIQLDKMNVFYIGVDNPVTISAAGYSLQDVFLSVEGADVKQGSVPGHYDVVVDKQVDVEAKVIAKKTGGGQEPVGSMKVRVKRIPDPMPYVGTKNGGFMSSAEFKVQTGVTAKLLNFDFDTKFSVVGFEMSILPKRAELIGPFKVEKSSRFDANSQLAEARSRCKPGDKVFIDNVLAVGPDKQTRKLPSLILTLQ
ncbi:MAG: gliding motility protein GldM [Flavipsychrobacter sp.]|nr:gliding motility protein GldM [Flavipsychrobacter sp.]